jgi:ribosomal protein S12 methylthiotransferase
MTRSPGRPGRTPLGAVYLLASPCPKASVDIEKLAFLLRSRGFAIARSPEDADLILTWGCGFIDDAKRESIDDVLAAVEAKQSGRARAVIVTGCLPEKYGDELAEALPEVDTFVGASSLGLLPEIIGHVLGGEDVRRVWLSRPFVEMDAGPGRDLSGETPWTRALLVSHGCDNRCTYCAIPQMQGGLRSREPDEIVREARSLVESGAREIVLAGQDIASYGRDLLPGAGGRTGRGATGLTGLVKRLAGESGAAWIRLCYAHPDNLDPAVADVMREHASVCRYLDLPIQHAAPSVLAAMGRRPEPEATAAKIARMRERVPDLALRTSVIVGFPGEREADFEMLLEFLKANEFDLIGAFEFSPQPQTPAARLPGRVPAAVRQERLVEVVRLAEEISRSRLARLIGRTLDVLVEETAEGGVVGRSEYDAPEVDRRVVVAGSVAAPGEFVKARVTGYTAWGHLEAVPAA